MRSGIGVLDKAMKILDVLAERELATLQQMADLTGLPRPTVHRLVRSLEVHGFLGRERNGYHLGARLVALGHKATGTALLIQLARPILTDLSEATGESAQLYLREANRRVCLASAERPLGLRDTVPLGALLPLDAGSGGKVLLAWSDDTEAFAVDQQDLLAVRRRGFAVSFGERETGVGSISAPVLDVAGHVQAAISISGPLSRINEQSAPLLAHQVLEAAGRLNEARGVPIAQPAARDEPR